MKLKKMLSLSAAVAVLGFAHGAFAAIVPVTAFQADPGAGSRASDVWYSTDVRLGGTATVGPAPTGQPGAFDPVAARLTTDATDAAKAEVGTFQLFGSAATVLNNISLSFDYYKTSSAGSNEAAPSLKLEIFAPGHGAGNDNYGVLVYEPYWNIVDGVSTPVPEDSWLMDSMTATSGLWWWNGGFNLPNSSGGPPLRTLADWATAFQTADPTDFPNAVVTGLIVGIGTFNKSQDVYFDAVSIKTGTIDTTYDFQQAGPPVPEPTTALFGLAVVGACSLARRRSISA